MRFQQQPGIDTPNPHFDARSVSSVPQRRSVGETLEEILDIMLVIEREHIDMLVISTHGLSGWRSIVFGSIAEKVIKLAECPLLLLRSAKPAAVTDVSTHIVAPGSSASYDLAHASQSSTSSAGITANPAVEVRLDAIASGAATRSARTEQHYDQDHPIFTK